MKDRFVITIGREFCSGGAEIGHILAKDLGFEYLDKEIIDQAATILNIDKDIVKAHDEKPVSLWQMPGYQYNGYLYYGDPSLMLPMNLRVSDAQFAAIRNTAQNGNCVIVGRCADYCLRDTENVFNVFIRAKKEDRIKRAMRLYEISEKDAAKLIKRTDSVRSDYYRYHTGNVWGESKNYHLVIDSSKLGLDAAASIIKQCIKHIDDNKKTEI